MKKKLLFISGIALSLSLNAQTPALNWGNNTQGTGHEYGRAVAHDASNNVYVVGNYMNDADLNPGVGVSSFSSNAGSHDIFVQKLDATGVFLWAKSFGSNGVDIAYDVAVAPDGSVYIIGVFEGIVSFDGGVNNKISNGLTDVFVLKLDANGNYQSVQTFGSTSDDDAKSIDANNNFYVIGCTIGNGSSNTADFDPSASDVLLTNGVIAKYNSDGTLGFAYGINGSTSDVKIDNSDNIYATGYYTGVFDFDFSVTDNTINNNGANDVFVVKYDVSGNYTWAKGFGGATADVGSSLSVDNSGNVYCVGYFNSATNFDNTGGTVSITPTGVNDGFVLKLDSNGDYVWVNSMHGGDKRIQNVEVDQLGHVYTSGYFVGSSLTIDPTGSNTALTGNGSYNSFVSVFNADSTLFDARAIYTDGLDVIQDGLLKSNGDYIFTGYQGLTMDIDPGNGTVNLVANSLSYESFVVNWNYNILNVSEIENNLNLDIYPNPATEYFVLAGVPIDATIQITDMTGKEVYKSVANSEKTTYNTSELNNGIYFVNVLTNGELTTEKLIVNN